MERKEFIRECGIFCLGSLVAGSLLESCMGNYYAITKFENNRIIIAKSEFIKIKDGVEKPRKYVLVTNNKLRYPICVFKINDTKYSALYMECTHNSCELNPHGDYLICPCHGSEFSNVGKVQNPPAETDLKQFKTTSDDENIYIQFA